MADAIPFNDRLFTAQPLVETASFQIDFPIFDTNDLTVELDGVATQAFSVSGTWTDGVLENATITPTTPADWVNKTVRIYGSRLPRRASNFADGRGIPASDHNLALQIVVSQMQEHQRDLLRSVKVPLGTANSITLPLLVPSQKLVSNAAGDALEFAPDTSTEVTQAAKNFRDAAQSFAQQAAISAGSITSAFLSVTAYGAVGDGLTDDTAAFVAALTAAAGKTLFIPAGTYMVNPLVVKSKTKIVGENRWSTTLKLRPQSSWSGNNRSIFTNDNILPSGFSGGSGARDCGIEMTDFSIDGNSSAQTAGYSSEAECISFFGVKDCLIERVNVYNATSEGIDIDASDRVVCRDILIDGCGKTGVHFSLGRAGAASGGCNDCVLDNALIMNCVGCAANDVWHLGRGDGNIFRNIVAIGCGQETDYIGSVCRKGKNGITENILVINSTKSGLGSGDTSGSMVADDRNVYRNIQVRNSGSVAVNICCENGFIDGIVTLNSKATGIYLSKCIGVLASGLSDNGAGAESVYLDNCTRCTFNSVKSEDATTFGLRFGGTNADCTVFNVDVANSGSRGIQAKGTSTNLSLSVVSIVDAGAEAVRIEGATGLFMQSYRLVNAASHAVSFGGTNLRPYFSDGAILDAGDHAFEIKGTTPFAVVEGLKIYGGSGDGFLSENDNGIFRNIDVFGVSGHGIYLTGTADDNVVQGGSVNVYNSVTPKTGLRVSGDDNWVVGLNLKGGATTETNISGTGNDVNVRTTV
ncbi:MAG: glycosyl hydrolase family 28-related protein [Pseudomonadota bacterium]